VSDIEARLDELRETGLYRRMRHVSGPQGSRVVLDGRPVLLLCSNNYLGLADHPRVREAAADAAMRWGAGAGGSRLVSGTMTVHRRLEEALAAFKGTESSVLFGSGYLANLGVIGALARLSADVNGAGAPPPVVFSDELNHASIIDGCRLARAETFVYDHCDVEHLAWGLRQHRGRGGLIVTWSRSTSWRGATACGPSSTRRTAPAAWARAGAARSPRRGSTARSTSSSARSARRSAPTARSRRAAARCATC
jgi:glycine C-acetyltransferase/8-amino-7-oxononanoate synthase